MKKKRERSSQEEVQMEISLIQPGQETMKIAGTQDILRIEFTDPSCEEIHIAITLPTVISMIKYIDDTLKTVMQEKYNPHYTLKQDGNYMKYIYDTKFSSDEISNQKLKDYHHSGKMFIINNMLNMSEEGRLNAFTDDLYSLVKKHAVCLYGYDNSNQRQLDDSEKFTTSIKIINRIWNYISNQCKIDFKLNNTSIDKMSVFGKTPPPIKEWIDNLPQDINEYDYDFIFTYFCDGKLEWKARIAASDRKTTYDVKILDADFIKSLQSADSNKENGLLFGDVYRCKCRIFRDYLNDKTIYEIIHVGERIRAKEFMHQQELNFAPHDEPST